MINFHQRKLVVKGLLCKALFFLILTIAITPYTVAKNSDLVTQFLTKTFATNPPKTQRLWINTENNQIIKRRFNPGNINISYKYWQIDDKTVWILNEIGKERNITTAIVIEADKIKNVEVLVYRESRGGQIRNKRFSQQYQNKHIKSNLIKEIDSISGATLSVNALNKQVKLALWLNAQK